MVVLKMSKMSSATPAGSIGGNRRKHMGLTSYVRTITIGTKEMINIVVMIVTSDEKLPPSAIPAMMHTSMIRFPVHTASFIKRWCPPDSGLYNDSCGH